MSIIIDKIVFENYRQYGTGICDLIVQEMDCSLCS